MRIKKKSVFKKNKNYLVNYYVTNIKFTNPKIEEEFIREVKLLNRLIERATGIPQNMYFER